MEGSSVIGTYTKIKLAIKVGKAVYDVAEPQISASLALHRAAKVMEAAAEAQEEVEKNENKPL